MTRILVLQLNRLGNLILTTPALAALRQNLPDAHITLAVDAGCREILPALGCVDDSLVFNRKGGNGAFWRKLIFASFDVCLDFTGDDRSAFFSILSKSHKRVTFQSVGKSRLRPVFYNTFVDSSIRENHTVDHHLHLLRALRIVTRDVRFALDLPEWSHKKAQQLLDESGVAGPFAMVHPGTSRPEKYWSAGRWAEVIGFCKNGLRLPCILTGGSETFEIEHIANIGTNTDFHDLCGRTDLLTLAALVQRARLLLSVDSVTMHLGAVFGTPQVALFGKTNPFHWRPRHEKAIVIQAGQPQPNPGFKPHHDCAPMTEISTEQVIGAIRLLFPQSAVTHS